MSLAFFTIVTANYLPRARVLADSVLRVHPEARMVVVVADERGAEIDAYAAQAGLELVYIDELELPRPRHFIWRYEVVELCTAIKPFCFQWLLRHTDAGRVIYLDPDILALAPFTPVLEAFGAGAGIVLTPHLLEPAEDGKRPGDLEILRAGAYNLGFLAVARGAESDDFLAWWGRRLEHHALVDFTSGLFTDQRWIDLVPAMYAATRICRDPGLNVAYWNLAQRRVECVDGRWQANGRPLVFFHFSGLNPAQPENISRYQDRFDLSTVGPVRQLCEQYVEALWAAGEAKWSARPHAWGALADGTPVNTYMRAVFRRVWDRTGPVLDGIDPALLTARDFSEPSFEVPRYAGSRISHFMYEFWLAHAHLREQFDLDAAEGQRRYAAWFTEHARTRMHLAEGLIPAQPRIARTHAGPLPPPRSEPLPALLRRWGFGLAHRTYLGMPSGLRETIRRVRPQALRRYVRERMMPVLDGTGESGPGLPGYSAWSREGGLPPAGADALVLAPGLTLVGYLAYSFGLGESGRALARACAAAQLDFEVINIEIGGRRADEEIPGRQAGPGLPRETALICMNADGMPHIPPRLRAAALPGQYRIGYWYWELEGFPKAWMGSFNEVDELWAASPFIRDCLAAVSPCPVVLMPPPVEVRLARQYTRAQFGLPERDFLFLFSYDFDSYVARKNPQACIEAFRRAFAPDDARVGLVIKTQHGDRALPARDTVRAIASADPRITLIESSLSRDETYGLISVCDCYLSLHRSEGYGLGMAEAMSLGKPVVATGYSGNLAFMRPDNSCLVGYELVPVREGEYPFWEGQQWAEPDIDEAARHMRQLVEDPALGARIGAQARAHMQAHFSAGAAGGRVRRRLDVIKGWRQGSS